jgi:predicted DNA-binding protein
MSDSPYIMVRVNPHEKERIEKFAEKLNKRPSTFMREVILSHISYTIDDKIEELKDKENKLKVKQEKKEESKNTKAFKKYFVMGGKK